MAYTAEIISVGTELLLGRIVNTNAQDVSQTLSRLGINVYYHTVVGDNPQRLKAAVSIAKSRADIIITTGGLGPTYDDLTKQTLAGAFGKKLVFNEEVAAELRSFFAKRLKHAKMPENNLRQAELPEGCIIFENPVGTAPGCAFEAEGTHVLMLPGPPRECRTMLSNCVVPYLSKLSDSEIHAHNIHIFGIGESTVETMLEGKMEKMQNPSLAPYAKDGEVALAVTAKAKCKEDAEAMMAPVLETVREIFGDNIYGIDAGSLEEVVVGLLTKSGKTVACGESCTGGLLSGRITGVSGASKVFLGAVVPYCVESKSELLGVSHSVIKDEGAVSRDVAIALAKGAMEKFGSDIGVGITGVAGPGPDENGREPGEVYIALVTDVEQYCRHINLRFDRNRVRLSATLHALDMIRRYLTGKNVENY